MKLGDRVILITEYHGCDDNNPVYAMYNVVGTIWRIDEDSSYIFHVKWDNGHGNNYRNGDLELADKYGCKDVYEIEKNLR